MNFPNEAAFMQAVVELAAMAGWLVHHDRLKQNVLGHAGFFDLCMVRRGRVIFSELKMDGKEPTPDQMKWLDAALLPLGELEGLQANMVRAVVWHPSDWDMIVRILTAR